MSNAEEISKLYALKQQGVLSEEEFSKEKAMLLKTQDTEALPIAKAPVSPEVEAEICKYHQNIKQLRKLKSTGIIQFILASLLVCGAVIVFVLFNWALNSWPEYKIVGSTKVDLWKPTVGDFSTMGLVVSVLICLAVVVLLHAYSRRKAAMKMVAEILKEINLTPKPIIEMSKQTSNIGNVAVPEESKGSVKQFLNKITSPTPIWVGFLVNAVAWVLFIMTGNHAVEFIMGTACLYCGIVGVCKSEQDRAKSLAFLSFPDAIWMYYWAFAVRTDTGSVMKLIEQLSNLTK